MTQELFILPEDLAYAVERRQELEAEIKGLGGEFGDVFTQSSETWHDNAPFEAVRDKQSVMVAELAKIKKVIHASAVRLPKPKKGTVGYGSIVTLSNGKVYKIAGDWTPYAGHQKDGALVVSANSSAGQMLFDQKLGTSVVIGRANGDIVAIA